MKKYLLLLVAISALASPATSYADICAFSYPSVSDDKAIGYAGGSNTDGNQLAMSFVPSSDCDVSEVKIRMSPVGSPSGGLVGYLYENSGSVPGSLLATGGTFSPLTGTRATSTSAFSSVSLDSGVTYWLVVKKGGTASATDYYTWASEASGAGAINTSGSWSVYDNDFVLEVVGNEPSPTPVVTGGATSSPEQTQDNLSTAFYLYFVSFFLIVWLMRKH